METTPRRETRVMVVDDDLGFGRVAIEMLTARGYTVVGHATTAEQAVTECARLDPDAVLLDVRLPDGNGFTLAERLQGGGDHLAILLTSTDPQAVGPAMLQRSVARGFVAKADLARTDLDRFLQRRARDQ